MYLSCTRCNKQIDANDYYLEVREAVTPPRLDGPKVFCSVMCFSIAIGKQAYVRAALQQALEDLK